MLSQIGSGPVLGPHPGISGLDSLVEVTQVQPYKLWVGNFGVGVPLQM